MSGYQEHSIQNFYKLLGHCHCALHKYVLSWFILSINHMTTFQYNGLMAPLNNTAYVDNRIQGSIKPGYRGSTATCSLPPPVGPLTAVCLDLIYNENKNDINKKIKFNNNDDDCNF